MNLFIEKHQELLKELLKNNVEFIIIGGYSVIFYGYPRSTGDVDIWLKPTNDNKEKIMNVLRAMDFSEADLQYILNLDFTQHVVFSMWDAPEKVDFITRINLVQFEDAEKRKVTANIDGIEVPFIHLNDLVLSKFNTGRLKDQTDIEELQKIQNAKNS